MDFLRKWFSAPKGLESPIRPKPEAVLAPKKEHQEFLEANFEEARKLSEAGISDAKEWIRSVYKNENPPIRIGNSGLYRLLVTFNEMLLAVGKGDEQEFWSLCENLKTTAIKFANPGMDIFGAQNLVKVLNTVLKEKKDDKTGLGIKNKLPATLFEKLDLIQSNIDMIAGNFSGIERSGGIEEDRDYANLPKEYWPPNYEFKSDSSALDNRKGRYVFALPSLIAYASNRLVLASFSDNRKVMSAMKKGLQSLVNNTQLQDLSALRQESALLVDQDNFDLSPELNRAHGNYILVLSDTVKHNGQHCHKLPEHNIEFYFPQSMGIENKFTISKGVA